MYQVGTVDRCGYVSQQKGTICDARGPCLSIWCTLKPVFHRIRLIHCAYKLFICLYLKIWRFLCSQRQRQHNPLPLAHAHGVTVKQYTHIQLSAKAHYHIIAWLKLLCEARESIKYMYIATQECTLHVIMQLVVLSITVPCSSATSAAGSKPATSLAMS